MVRVVVVKRCSGSKQNVRGHPRSVKARTKATIRLTVRRYNSGAEAGNINASWSATGSFDDEAKAPNFESIQFPLSVPALFGSRTTAVRRLDGDDFWRRSDSSDRAGVYTGGERVVHGTDEDLRVDGSHVVRVRFELRLGTGDER